MDKLRGTLNAGKFTSPDITVEKVIDMSFAQAAVKELGPYHRKAP